jgi:hypothetical protein
VGREDDVGESVTRLVFTVVVDVDEQRLRAEHGAHRDVATTVRSEILTNLQSNHYVRHVDATVVDTPDS